MNFGVQDYTLFHQDIGVTLCFSTFHSQKIPLNPRDKGNSLSSDFDSIQKHINDAVEDTRKECGWKTDFVLPYVEDVSELLYFETKLLEDVETWILPDK